MGKMTVYHGSYTTVENPKIIHGKIQKILVPVFTVPLSANRRKDGQNDMILLWSVLIPFVWIPV